MACSRLLGNSCGISNGKYLFAIVRHEPRHCSYTQRCVSAEMKHQKIEFDENEYD